jgi:hypothetical protein
MTISRRDALKTLAAVPALIEVGSPREVGSSGLQAGDPPLAALAEAVLPSEADRVAAIAAFTRWIDNYTEGADTDHGYGVTRVRATGPSPAKNYPAQIAALDAAARAAGAGSFAGASVAQRRAIVEAALTDAKIERLPVRPNGGHIAADLMAHYFNSSAANDLCYRAAINRDACRGLAGSDVPPKGGNSGERK